MKYQPVIGLEIHVELNTKSKMFCSCPNDPDEKHPNINVCPICLGHPGTLPVINKEAVKKVIKTGLALNCQILEYSKFDRKSYFYPDLPKGYQISQYDMPLCKDGFLLINRKKIRIKRVHLEEDTGRLIHEKDYSLVDFNRAGIPLMELVTKPDLKSAKEARKFAEEFQLILRYLNVSNADMEKGQMRVEVNVSLQATRKLGTKVEIKNLNSFRAVERAIDYEIERQTRVLDLGKKVIQETRGWDESRGVTLSQREKEEAHDYRYFPEPDLPPLHFRKEEIDEIGAEIPELPQQRRKRFKKEYKLKDLTVEFFVQNKDLGEYFEKVVSEFEPRLSPEKLSKLIKLATNYLITDLQGLLKGASVSGEDFLITPENFAEFITLIADGKISSKIAKTVLEEMFKAGADPSHIIEEKELSLVTDEVEIEKTIKEVISKNQKAVLDFKKGKENALQFLIGQVMVVTKGRANPQIVRKILGRVLDKIS
ncbi:Asp-tRNA(Asn)/Glu-tRNA(Gln) amidotransferase subunit GatB [Patescibacteria group bacterium]|nr:Asp-tRNA(Asn)/Glu-tRNA(Gln) amidotransferase subunit GatB [Patescibacteria group bacterium]